MDAIALSIRTTGLVDNVFAYQPKSFVPPCAIVRYPPEGSIVYNQAFKDGMYKATFTVDFVVGSVNGLESRDALSDILDGAASVAKVLQDKNSHLAAVVDTVAVSDAGIVFLPATTGDELLAARFTVEVGGS
jgi:hypothetical protein